MTALGFARSLQSLIFLEPKHGYGSPPRAFFDILTQTDKNPGESLDIRGNSRIFAAVETKQREL
jgi:hypothetical protein